VMMADPLLSMLALAVLVAAADAFSTAPPPTAPLCSRGRRTALSSSLVNDGIFQTSPPLRIEGNSLKTWTLPAGVARRVQVSLRSPGRPIEASVELWQTPSYTPTKFTVECEDASENVVHAIVELPDGLPTTLAVYNTEGQEFPVDATVQAVHDGGAAPLAVASFSGQRPVYVEGNGAVKSFNFGPDIEEVEVLLTTSLRNMKAYIEILRGPNDDNEIVNVETDNASVHPFYTKIVCADGLNTLRIVNENTLEFPLEAYVRPFDDVGDGERPQFNYGGPYF